MRTVFETHYYRLTKLFCSIVGLWPYQTQKKKIVTQSFNIFILLSYLPPQLTRLYQVWGKDIDAMCMCMPPLLSLILCLFKNVTIYRFQPKIKMLLRQIETYWERTSKGEEYEILISYTSKARKLCFIYTILMNSGLLCYVVIPMISPILDIILPINETRERSLGFDLDYGIDSQTYWFWLWLHSSTVGTSVIFNMVAADLLYITLIMHGCYLFGVVKYKFEHMTDSITKHAVKSFDNSNCSIECHSHLYENQRRELEEQSVVIRECVISHKKAIECAQLLHRIYTWTILGTASVNVIITSISAVQLVSKLFQWSEMFMSSMYVIGDLTHLLFLSLPAQYILDQSLKVHESAYSCFWYNMPAKLQKDVIFILMRSRSPCKLMGGKLFVLSMETFSSILQTSMSYFTLLVSFR